MVHRDPETGQFMSHDDTPLDLNYTDHEFINFYLTLADNGGPSSEVGTEFKIEDDVLGLENDELGMLSWMTATMSVGFTEFEEVNETRGGAQVSAEIGANLADEEFLGLAESDEGVNVMDQPTQIATGALQANDEPGLWAALTAGAQSPFKAEDVDGDDFSGGGDFNTTRQTRHYYDETGEGPYIDSTDDINVGILTEKDRAESELRVQLLGQMSFLVYEYENRRAEFAPYDPGPSMGD